MEKYKTGDEIEELNHRRMVAKYWNSHKKGSAEYAEFKDAAEKIVQETKRCTVEQIFDIALQGRAMNAHDAYQTLINDRGEALETMPHTDH